MKIHQHTVISSQHIGARRRAGGFDVARELSSSLLHLTSESSIILYIHEGHLLNLIALPVKLYFVN